MGDLKYRDLDLQSDGLWFDLASGLAEPAEVRGDDVVIPGKAGRTWMPKVADRRVIELRGHVHGMGVTLADRQAHFRERTDALMAVLDFTAAAGTLEVLGPYLGIEDGMVYEIEAVSVNVVGGDVKSTMTFQRWSIRLEALGDPPAWVITS